MSYPDYARSERIADGAMHLLGVIGACGGAAVLMAVMPDRVAGFQGVALAIYGVALVATFAASASYHMTPWESLRPALRRLDHAAIYLKIAGTYTPLVVMIGSMGAYLVLGLVWALAAFGMIRKMLFWRTPGRYDPLLYLFMGWLSLFLIWSLVPLVPLASIVFMALGGLLYTVGVVFYNWDSLRFSTAIWHGFVLCASACFYGAILLGTLHTTS